MHGARTPEETSTVMSAAISAGDLDAAVAMFEPDACFAQLGSVAVGTEAIRRTLAELLEITPALQGRPSKVLRAGDIAIVYGTWIMHGRGPDGNDIDLSGRYTDVVRLQPDGRWLFVIDNPWGFE
ncbi:MAG: nuclear transport factor 2 family protein [Actinomycetota bacterium]|nr:nuclear transport factor 2 family protein [Actinomycetota bacterium]